MAGSPNQRRIGPCPTVIRSLERAAAQPPTGVSRPGEKRADGPCVWPNTRDRLAQLMLFRHL